MSPFCKHLSMPFQDSTQQRSDFSTEIRLLNIVYKARYDLASASLYSLLLLLDLLPPNPQSPCPSPARWFPVLGIWSNILPLPFAHPVLFAMTSLPRGICQVAIPHPGHILSSTTSSVKLTMTSSQFLWSLAISEICCYGALLTLSQGLH